MFRFRDTRSSGSSRLALAIVLCTALAVPPLIGAGAGTATPGQAMTAANAATLAFAPKADARVEEAHPRRNFGADPGLRVDGGAGPDVRSYLRFQVSGVTGTITGATLRLYVPAGGGTTNGPKVYRARNDWREAGITWNRRPKVIGGPYDNAGAIAEGSWARFDVARVVRGDGTYTFALFPESGDGVNFHAREAANAPQLVVETDAGGPEPGADSVLLAAGDIASCTSSGDERTAELLDGLAGTVAALGDLAYQSGTAAEFADCYGPTWGRHKARTRPAPGNHDYKTDNGGPYHDYFGAAAGERGKGWYSYDLGSWHVIALNSNCALVGGCGAGSPQHDWLLADLAAHPSACTLAYWHHARFSSGQVHGDNTAVQPLWQALYDAWAEVVLVGHEHNYERFAPLDAAGNHDPARGVRQFVVGTGGNTLYGFGTVRPNSEARNADARGVLL